MDAEFTFKLIQEIKKRPIIYSQCHPDNGNKPKRLQAWNIIAQELNEEVPALKSKWKNLRDSYKKHKQAKNGTGSIASKKLYKWSWGEYMRFIDSPVDIQDKEDPSNPNEYLELIPPGRDDVSDPVNSPTNTKEKKKVKTHDKNPIQNAQTKRNYEDTVRHLKAQKKVKRQHGAGMMENKNLTRNSQRKRTYNKNRDRHLQVQKGVKRRHTTDSETEVENSTQSTQVQIHNDERHLHRGDDNTEEKLDSVDLLFMGYADTFKRLPRREQILLKFRIAKIFMEAELSDLDTPRTPGPSSPVEETRGNSETKEVLDPDSLDYIKGEMDPNQ